MNKQEDMAGREGETDGQMRKGNGHELWFMERTLQQASVRSSKWKSGDPSSLPVMCVCVAMYCIRRCNVCMKW